MQSQGVEVERGRETGGCPAAFQTQRKDPHDAQLMNCEEMTNTSTTRGDDDNSSGNQDHSSGGVGMRRDLQKDKAAEMEVNEASARKLSDEIMKLSGKYKHFNDDGK